MANTDLQQRNETPYFAPTADVNTNTDPYLVPTDGKIISAQNNGTNEAPILPVLLKIRGTLAGLRGALVGDFAGAVQKTVRSFYADDTGGNTHAKAAGTIVAKQQLRAEIDGIVAEAGDIVATTGKIRALGDYVQALVNGFIAGNTATAEYSNLTAGILRFLGTTATNSNPARGTSLKNQLRAVNVLKYSGRIKIIGGVITVEEGAGNWSASTVILAGKTYDHRLRITLADAFANIDYSVTYGMNINDNEGNVPIPITMEDTLAVGQFDICFFNAATNAVTQLYPQTTDLRVSFHVHGIQTT
jgi:hypothetical protein